MKQVRCAIYTRKSTEEGLDQEFNSLHAQREACEAYIKSQKHEGWELLPEQYDDGGFSGGNMERPALKKLMAEIEAGNVDVIVVYKVDRLTRSLVDFVKLVEVMDEKEVSFVSITQQFNTTTSMGRLTLNVLLSFAQFEREVTGERIRDKIALSKQKGKWMGGAIPLGYDVKDKKLLVNEREAKTVRHIFERYLELRSVNDLKAELDEEGHLTKARGEKGGKPFWKGHLYRVLQNRLYVGEVTHKGKSYPGEHDGIVDKKLFDDVQEVIAKNRQRNSASTGRKEVSLLAGKIFDDQGHYMTPKHSRTRKRYYRYYTSQAVIKSTADKAGSLPNIPAHEIEELVRNEMQKLLSDEKKLQRYVQGEDVNEQKNLLGKAKEMASDLQNIFIRSVLSKVVLSDVKVRMILCAESLVRMLKGEFVDEADLEPENEIVIEKEIKLAATNNGSKVIVGGITGRANMQLIKAIARSFLWHEQLISGEVKSQAEIQRREGMSSAAYIGKIMKLRFLSPDVIESILDGTNPPDWTVEKLFQAETLKIKEY